MGINRFGDRRTQRAMRKWEEKITEKVKRIIFESAYILQTEARSRAPEDSGYLRQSIEVEILNDGLSARVIVSADYAIYIEYGTGIYAVNGNGRQDGWTYFSDKFGEFVFTEGMKPQPFWFDAIAVAQQYFKREMQKLGI
ncbi:HK97-gp10 family putative phage morphogenesis protein [Lysinibacillus sp. SGAir0095]|uniref:HK97-gp10 family putative phage morphogenesis protein n=1 Tax=Lysinibacillus sp. SGAir0095 TaxID=2070463 RepID=UPI0010CD239E|nr:HK97-gp10 family putative phage morphogenesis protein [Lysinibacillus sp. SGAir0095]QCR33127.1 hypothetical protein C1N55_13465 [Lysinibacillus sp. SGAir0095]